MKVVLFCGGLGLRLRDYSDTLPKPMVPIGGTPVLIHIMQYYMHFGHKEFILCLGYRADAIRQHFFNHGAEPVTYSSAMLSTGTAVEAVRWRDCSVTFAMTGDDDNIGGRLRRVRPLVENDEMFLANYSDDLTDVRLDDMVSDFRRHPSVVGSFLAVRPNLSMHVVVSDADGSVTGIVALRETSIRVNGGYFVLRPQIFDVMMPGEELVEEPFARLIERKALRAYTYDGFWGPLDTLKDHHALEDMDAHGAAPWKVWQQRQKGNSTRQPDNVTQND